MANPVRKQILAAFVTQVTGLATTGANVFQDRTRNLAETDLPALRVYDDDEQLDDNSELNMPYLQRRNIVIRCEAVAKAATDIDDTLDLMCKEVEVALAANSTLNGLAKLHCVLNSTDIEMDDQCEVTAGKAAMLWHGTAFTMSNAPSVAL